MRRTRVLIRYDGRVIRLRRSAEMAAKLNSRSLLPASIIGLCHYLFADLDPDDADWFLTRLADGDGLAAEDPIAVLRNRCFGDPSLADLPAEQALEQQNALAAVFRGRNDHEIANDHHVVPSVIRSAVTGGTAEILRERIVQQVEVLRFPDVRDVAEVVRNC